MPDSNQMFGKSSAGTPDFFKLQNKSSYFEIYILRKRRKVKAESKRRGWEEILEKQICQNGRLSLILLKQFLDIQKLQLIREAWLLMFRKRFKKGLNRVFRKGKRKQIRMIEKRKKKNHNMTHLEFQSLHSKNINFAESCFL